MGLAFGNVIAKIGLEKVYFILYRPWLIGLLQIASHSCKKCGSFYQFTTYSVQYLADTYQAPILVKFCNNRFPRAIHALNGGVSEWMSRLYIYKASKYTKLIKLCSMNPAEDLMIISDKFWQFQFSKRS